MGRKKKEKKWGLVGSLKEETKHSMLAVIFFVIAVFLVLASWGKSGVVGALVFNFLEMLLGIGYFILPLIVFILGLSFLKSIKPELVTTKIVGAILFFLSGIGTITIIFKNGSGGIVGKLIASPLLNLFDIYASLILLVAILIISTLLMFDTRLGFGNLKFSWFKKKDDDIDEDEIEEKEEEYEDEEEDEDDEEEEMDEEDEDRKDTKSKLGIFGIGKKKDKEEDSVGVPILNQVSSVKYGQYTIPPLSLLRSDSGKPGVGDIKANANMIKRTLQNFGITVEMDEISVGPTVTRYALKPAEGVKLSRIVGLQNDLGLALAAHPIRIEAPIPGKSLVGIEVPNHSRSTVGLSNLLSSSDYQNSDKPLLFTLGKGISGKSFFSNLAKLPHVLIAGATGSGKSVTIHAIITSLLYKNPPENMRFIMIDPKRVELTLYNKIPHLLTPVITDAKKAILSLKWAAKEMDRRYDILESESVRDIESYHKNIVAPAYASMKNKTGDGEIDDGELPETMPYIVIVIDELADIMTSYPKELEAAIVRLAQMSRAVGIHLILSTQRPSVNVITGLIKANVPGRIALQVSSQIDSRTILDTGGAEKLLGSGDMLYLSSDMSQPQRIQSAFVTEDEVKKVVKYLSKQYEDELPSELNLTENSDKESLFDTINGNMEDNKREDEEDDDELYEDAYNTVVEAGKASTSYLQRKLRIGYARAARLMDILEDRGIIGPADGSRPREVLVDDENGYENNEEVEENEEKEEEN
jgi:S-DNA-T family DNA segregation ATPase FtsK/SpoIIIE